MPVFGQTMFLMDSIDSVFQQSYTDFELIIVDDNDPTSTFRTETTEIIRQQQELGRRIKYICHDRNRNGATARNTGFKEASGDYISFLDSDDFYLPLRIEQAVDLLESTGKEIGGFYSGVEFRRSGKMYNTFEDACQGNFIAETLACRFQLGTGSNLFLKRTAFEAVGGFDETFWRHQDYEFLVRFFEHFDLAATKEVLVVKNNENYNLPNYSKSLEIKKQYLWKYRTLIETLPREEQNYIARSNYVWLGEMALREGLRGESRRMYKKANEHGTTDPKQRLRRLAFWLKSWAI